jgi:DNA-binding NtrC family response regulator
MTEPERPPFVLVVDDDAAVVELVERVLVGLGYRVATAGTSRDALAAARAVDRLDVLISDVNVPGAGGRRLAAEIGALHPRARVIYISGFPAAQIAEEGIVTGSPTFLAKPFRLGDLADAVVQLAPV